MLFSKQETQHENKKVVETLGHQENLDDNFGPAVWPGL